MRHKYDTLGIVLARSPVGEATALITLLTPDLGLVQARAQSVRNPGAKLAAALSTLTESEVILVRGKEGWRLAGAVLIENWFTRLEQASARECVARVLGLFLRLVVGETPEAELYPIMRDFFEALVQLPEDAHEAVEILAVLRILGALGLDAGKVPTGTTAFAPELLTEVLGNRAEYVARINTGIAASGL